MNPATRAFLSCLAMSPMLLLTVGGWMSGVLFLSCGLALWILLVGPATAGPQRHAAIANDPGVRGKGLALLVLLFASPVLAILLGQVFRQTFAWRDYDSPARFLLCIPILLVLVRQRLDAIRNFTVTVPCGLLITLLVVVINPHAGWVKERIATYFVDPLTFGSLSLTLGLLSLLSIDLYARDSGLLRLYKLLGFAVGMYLSILSESRTGWLALPCVLLFWMSYKLPRYRGLAVIGVLLISAAIYACSDTVQQRIHFAWAEFTSYQWNALNPQTSVGDRLSVLRIAAFLFSQSPLGGFGDRGFGALIGQPEFNRFAVEGTQMLALHAGFHNEIATNMVRSGIWGLLSSIALFGVPAAFFLRNLWSGSAQVQRIALFALGYWTCTFVSAMTTEVFNLKFTASFHALVLAVLTGSLLVHLWSGEEAPHEPG